MKDRGRLDGNTAVVTVMSNLGFMKYMQSIGIDTARTAVGDRYVLEEMRARGYAIGGEQSGHVIFLHHSTTGDGELTAGKLLKVLARKKAENGAKMSDLNAVYNGSSVFLASMPMPCSVTCAQRSASWSLRYSLYLSATGPVM